MEVHSTTQSDSRSGPITPGGGGGLKTRAWGARTHQCASKSASPLENIALGAHLPPNPGMAAMHQVDPSPLEIPTAVQSDSRSGPSTVLRWLKMPARGSSTPQCAFKSASPVEKLARGAHLPPKPGLVSSHSVEPSPLEMAIAVKSDARGGFKRHVGRFKRAHSSLFGFMLTFPGEKLALGAHLPPKPGLVALHSVEPSPLEMAMAVKSDFRGGSKAPCGTLQTRTQPPVRFKLASAGENSHSGFIYHQVLAWSTRNRWTPVPGIWQ